MNEKIIGIIPAAGKGSRISPLPCSKELIPIGFDKTVMNGTVHTYPKVVSEYLLDRMKCAGIKRVFFIISDKKLDIVRYYGSGRRIGINICYLVKNDLLGMPYSINQAYPWVMESTIVFGMPDTIFTPQNVYTHLLHRHKNFNADVTLGLFKTNFPSRFGMVKVDQNDCVIQCIDKPFKTSLKYMWGIACWSPSFTKFLNEELEQFTLKENDTEVVLGDIFQLAIKTGLNIRAVKFENGKYTDIGNPTDLKLAIEEYSNQPHS